MFSNIQILKIFIYNRQANANIVIITTWIFAKWPCIMHGLIV